MDVQRHHSKGSQPAGVVAVRIGGIILLVASVVLTVNGFQRLSWALLMNGKGRGRIDPASASQPRFPRHFQPQTAVLSASSFGARSSITSPVSPTHTIVLYAAGSPTQVCSKGRTPKIASAAVHLGSTPVRQMATAVAKISTAEPI